MRLRFHNKLATYVLFAAVNCIPAFAAQSDSSVDGQEELIEDMRELAQSNPELMARLTEAVIVLKDPKSIPVLISVLGNGSTATPIALAEFGELAIPGLITVIAQPEGPSHQVHAALLSLRCMIENDKLVISSASIAAIKDVLSSRLATRQEFVTNLWRDIDLAIALGDPELTRIVELIASDQEALIERGVNAPDLIHKTQALARDRLNGAVAMPICEDFRARIANRFAQ